MELATLVAGQSVIRMMLAKLRCKRIREDNARSEEERRLMAVTKMQAGARKMSSLKDYRQVILSTKVLQGWVRGMLARILFEMLLRRTKSATRVQAWARGLIAVEEARVRYKAMILLQRAVRSWRLILAAKRLLEELRRKLQEENEAAAAALSPIVVQTPGKDNGIASVEDGGSKFDSTGSVHSEFTPGQATTPGDEGYYSSGEGDSSPEKSPVFQLRYSPNKESQGHNNELYSIEVMGEGDSRDEYVNPVNSPSIDQETKFRLEREAREEDARGTLAARLQARARGARSRKQIGAMKRVAAALSNINHVAKCRIVVKQLIRERNRCAELVQKIVRGFVERQRVSKARAER